jgi:BCCT family betaine/carnitine transporter
LGDATGPQRYRIDNQIGQDKLRRYGMDLHNPVLWITAFLILIFVIGTLMAKRPQLG